MDNKVDRTEVNTHAECGCGNHDRFVTAQKSLLVLYPLGRGESGMAARNLIRKFLFKVFINRVNRFMRIAINYR